MSDFPTFKKGKPKISENRGMIRFGVYTLEVPVGVTLQTFYDKYANDLHLYESDIWAIDFTTGMQLSSEHAIRDGQYIELKKKGWK